MNRANGSFGQAHVPWHERLRDDEGQKLAAELRKLGSEAEFLPSDVRHEGDVRNLINKAVMRFGRLDAAVNCAGTEGCPAATR